MNSPVKLIVNDKEENLYFLETLLKGKGHTVFSGRNGVEALEILRKKSIDLIISDILMPKMDGFQFCRICKKDRDLDQIPFVFYTATYTEAEDEKYALSIGADRFIRKPEEPDKFLEILEKVLKDQKGGKLKTIHKRVLARVS